VVARDDKKVDLEETEETEELQGRLDRNPADDKLMHSVMENDAEEIDKGKMLESAFNQGIGSFMPDAMFEQLVNNFSVAKNLYGEKILREAFGYDPNYIEKNLQIPEFQRELKRRVKDKMASMRKEGLLDKEGDITDKGLELASLVSYITELDNILPKGVRGERVHKKHFIYGDNDETKPYSKGDRYRDIEMKKSIKTAIRRGHDKLEFIDLKVNEKQAKGQCYLVYAIDSSGSMRGDKIGTCKRAGISLAFNAIQNRDKVGMIVFGDEVKEVVEPTDDFMSLLRALVQIKASKETNMVDTVQRSIEVFPKGNVTKHLILLTDAIPTVGKNPEYETLEACGQAASNGITISVVGINLDEKGKKLARQMADIGQGRVYLVRDLQEINKIVLEDYHHLS